MLGFEAWDWGSGGGVGVSWLEKWERRGEGGRDGVKGEGGRKVREEGTYLRLDRLDGFLSRW